MSCQIMRAFLQSPVSSARRKRRRLGASGVRLSVEQLEERRLLSISNYVGDLVWDDSNANGIQDVGESGIAGAVVELFDAGDGVIGNGDDVSLGSQTTDASGAYQLGPLVEGHHYYLEFRPPAGMTITTQDAVADDLVDSDADPVTGRTAVFTWSGTAEDIRWDTGMRTPPVLGDLVWHDADGNGIQNAGEPGIAGVVVELFDAVDGVIGNGDDQSLGTRITDGDGRFHFLPEVEGLRYYFQFYLPDGFMFTRRDAGGSMPTDSDADPATGRTDLIYWAPGYDDPARDAGMLRRDNDPLDFGSAVKLPGSLAEVAADHAGNIYVAGPFQGIVDVDPGPGALNLTSAGHFDAYLGKYSSAGDLLWGFGLGASGYYDEIYRISADAAGNVVVYGDFSGTADFDPGPATFELTSPAGQYTEYLAKYSAAGELVWAFGTGGEYFLSDVVADPAGSVFVTGRFQGTVDLDPGSATFELSSPLLAWSNYLAKYSATGELLWAFLVDGDMSPQELAIDPEGSLYVTGYCGGTVDFDPGPGAFELTFDPSYEAMFLAKYTSTGEFAWASGIQVEVEHGATIAVDPAGNVLIAAEHQGKAVFGLTPGSFELPGLNDDHDSFVAKYSPTGGFLWAVSFAGPGGEEPAGIAADATGNVYVVGTLGGPTDMDPDPDGIYPLGGESFLVKLNGAGNFLQATQLPRGSISDIALAPDGTIWTVGDFWGTLDFDPGADTYELTAPAANESFLWKLTQSAPTMPSLGTVDFSLLQSQNVSGGPLWYQLTTRYAGQLTLEAGDAGLHLDLFDESSLHLRASTAVNGRERLDYPVAAGETFRVRLSGTAEDADVRIVNLVEQSGTTVTVHGTAGNDEFVFDASAPIWQVAVQGVAYEFTEAQAGRFHFDGLGGSDHVRLAGGGEADRALLRPSAASLEGGGYAVTAVHVESSTFDGGGGNDLARLYGLRRANALTAGTGGSGPAAGYTALTGSGVSITAKAERIDADGGGGRDTAAMYRSADSEVFQSFWKWAGMAGQDSDCRVKDFQNVSVLDSGGTTPETEWLDALAQVLWLDDIEKRDLRSRSTENGNARVDEIDRIFAYYE